MGWIKRNLFFVVSGVVALVLLGGAGYFIYDGWARNSEASGKLNDLYDKLQQLAQQQPQPGNNKVDNVKTAKEEEQQVNAWMTQATAYFKPIPPIPQGEVTSKTFASALSSTVYQLQQAAKDSSIGLPQQYYFSFQVQSSMLTISSGLTPLAQQLGEVKAITDILFAARVNDLVSIQRVRVSDDDVAKGLPSDYTDLTPITNDLAIITPYVVTFRCFTPELAKVLSGFASSTYPFVVKSVTSQPDTMAAATAGMPGGYPQPGEPLPMGQLPGMPPGRYPGMPMGEGGMAPQPGMAPMVGKGGLQTVLKEKMIRITLEVDIVKLLPKS